MAYVTRIFCSSHSPESWVNRLTQVHSENGRLSLYIVCVRPKNNDFPNVV